MDVGAEIGLDKRFDKSLFPGSVNAVGTGLGPHIIHVPTSTLGGPHPDSPFADEETESQAE